MPDALSTLQIRATGQAPDGMTVRDAVVFSVSTRRLFRSSSELRKTAEQVAQRDQSADGRAGRRDLLRPGLFRRLAGAQLMAEVLAPQLALPRRPISEPGRPVPVPGKRFRRTGRVAGSAGIYRCRRRPDAESLERRSAAGSYEFDYEGVVPTPLTLVEKGRLKNFLLTRSP